MHPTELIWSIGFNESVRILLSMLHLVVGVTNLQVHAEYHCGGVKALIDLPKS